ncbi:MAG TPA: ABC transporter permease [Pirellulales bacterium]|nr:ABC transporter permease [Pirellulales bacterium]
MIFIYSFNRSRLGGVWTGFSTRWYAELFQRSELWKALGTSTLIAACASSLSTILGTLAAFGLRHWRRRTRDLARGLFSIPLVVPDMIIGVSLALYYHSLAIERGLATIIVAHMVFGVSYAFVVMSAAVKLLDETLFAAALDCGATPWQSHRWVTIPTLAPSLGVAWLLVFVMSFDDFLITFFSKGLGNDTLPIKIYSQMRFGLRPATNALFAVIFLVTVVGVAVGAWLSYRRPNSHLGGTISP